MITYTNEDKTFRLEGAKSSYWFRVTTFGHLEHIYYGKRLEAQPIDALLLKRTATLGSSVVYDKSDPLYVLDAMPLEWSGNGSGDYRYCPAEIRMPNVSGRPETETFSHDFVYVSHEIFDGVAEMETLPGAYSEIKNEKLKMENEDGGEELGVRSEENEELGVRSEELGVDDTGKVQTLRIELKDKACNVTLCLYYTMFPQCDVIVRRCVLRNNADKPLEIRRLMSMMLDLPDKDYKMLTFDGNWIKEAHLHERPIAEGMYVNASTTGASSNRHNPGFIIAERRTDEEAGIAYGLNLVYSGNHFGFVERDSYNKIRMGIGINPHCFSWKLEKGEAFETPEAVLSFSDSGFNTLSHNFHDFINEHIVRGDWKGKERPVLLNNWEAHFFNFTRRKLLKLAGGAAKLGVELFVLDDGWFGARNSDNAGLGDYNVNTKKLGRGGMRSFAGAVRKKGLKFGLWFEPEMVNEDSDLYRAHPEYAVVIPGRNPALGRNQLVLDLCNPKVRDYIVENVTRIIDEAGIDYIKWDMNRHISDAYSPTLKNQGEFYHRYILGLYEVLGRIFYARPHVLFESCSSGGNRFDLGMLCYSPQIWTSDDTDPVVRQRIQGSLSYLYPLSTMGAHVSESPHQQTLRRTLLATRFNTACFGALGYELDLKYLTGLEKKEISEQIAFYKKHRRIFQYGRFDRIRSDKRNQIFWQVTDELGVRSEELGVKDGERVDIRNTTVAITGFFQVVAETADGHSILRVKGLEHSKTYDVKTKPQRVFVSRFGGLVKHILPVELNPDGALMRLVNRVYPLFDCAEHYTGDGKLLEQGIFLNNQFVGSYYNEQTQLLGDFGSYLFTTELRIGNLQKCHPERSEGS